jgi:hypothetical protein
LYPAFALKLIARGRFVFSEIICDGLAHVANILWGFAGNGYLNPFNCCR